MNRFDRRRVTVPLKPDFQVNMSEQAKESNEAQQNIKFCSQTDPNNVESRNSSNCLNNNENILQKDQGNNETQSSQTNSAHRVSLKDFYEVTKFKLSVMNTLVALPTYLYLSEIVSPQLIPLALATQLMAMSSQTVNQILEVNYDKLMQRTQKRPLPSGNISRKTAMILASATFISSNAIFLSFFPLSTALVANGIFFSYIGIYTPLKRISTINTSIGAIVGALTPYIGYTAAGGSVLDLYPLYYALYMIFWQFQHFYGISWIYKNDYKKAGFKMCENEKVAVSHIIGSFCVNAIANYALFFSNPIFPQLSLVYSAIMTATYIFCFAAPTYKFYMNPGVQTAKDMKIKSYIHLSVFFLIIIVDTCIRIYEHRCKKGLNKDGSHTGINQESLLGKVHNYILPPNSSQRESQNEEISNDSSKNTNIRNEKIHEVDSNSNKI